MLKTEILYFVLVGNMISDWEDCENLFTYRFSPSAAVSRFEYSDFQLVFCFILPIWYCSHKQSKGSTLFLFPTWYLVGIPFFLSTDLGLVSLGCWERMFKHRICNKLMSMVTCCLINYSFYFSYLYKTSDYSTNYRLSDNHRIFFVEVVEKFWRTSSPIFHILVEGTEA